MGGAWVQGGKPQLAEQLVRKGFYISYGVQLLNPSSTLISSLRATPTHRIFIETDSSEIPIGRLYSTASEMLGIPMAELEGRIEENYRAFFGK